MSIKHGSVLNFTLTKPDSPNEGDMYFDSITQKIYQYQNGQWLKFNPSSFKMKSKRDFRKDLIKRIFNLNYQDFDI